MKSKSIIIKGDKQEAFIRLIAWQFGVSADKEIQLIMVLCKYDMFLPFFMDKYTRIKLINAMGTNKQTFSTCLGRLVKANVIARHKKTMYFNTAFRNLEELDSIVFKVG